MAVTGSATGVTAVTAGDTHSLAIQAGAAFAWGDNTNGRLGNNSPTNSSVPVAVSGLAANVTGVSAGYKHSLSVQNGRAYAWGSNSDGQLGLPTATASSLTPVAVGGLVTGLTVTQVAAGGYHSLALTHTGRLFAWGLNSSGQLGNNTRTSSATPVEIFDPSGYVFSAIDGASNFTTAVVVPVPEPAGLLVAAGLAVGGVARVRRRGRGDV